MHTVRMTLATRTYGAEQESAMMFLKITKPPDQQQRYSLKGNLPEGECVKNVLLVALCMEGG